MATETIPEWRLNDRVKRAIEHGHVNKQQWADECGVTIKAVYHWCSGHSRPRRAALKELARLSGVPLEWLETGREEGGSGSNWTLPLPGQLVLRLLDLTPDVEHRTRAA